MKVSAGVPDPVRVRFPDVAFEKNAFVDETRVVAMSCDAVRLVPVAAVK